MDLHLSTTPAGYHKIVFALFIVFVSGVIDPDLSTGAGGAYATLKISPPPQGGIYIGQYEWQDGDIDTFEKAIGRKTAWWSKFQPWQMNKSGHPTFDPQEAEKAWQAGKVIRVSAYEAFPGDDEKIEGFTVDKLLKGVFDSHLRILAAQFRQFGKPMFFFTAEEPNGVISSVFGGFGPKGDKSLLWALQNKKGFVEFDPSAFPYPQLYNGLGDPTVSDGVERLVAAHRYYYDFFVRREGLKFLTFDAMGWAALGPHVVESELKGLPPEIDRRHAKSLLESSYDFRNIYPGNDYIDWVSINFYMLDYYAKDWEGYDEDWILPDEYYFLALAYTMNKIREVAPGKPVFFAEFGFPDGMKKNSQKAARKITAALKEIIKKYPEIHGFSMWSYHPAWANYFPWDCLIRPNTKQAFAFRKAIRDYPDHFHSCVYLSDGRKIPTCTDN